jgi:hypothetical protein
MLGSSAAHAQMTAIITPGQIELTFEKSPELLDTLWGYYFATGSEMPTFVNPTVADIHLPER